MKLTKLALPLVLLVMVIFTAACSKENTQSFRVDIKNQLEVQATAGTQLRLLTFVSSHYYLDQKQADVLPQLEAAINSGDYNIVSIQTSYSSGYLVAADVTYDSSGPGVGNSIRVIFLTSDRYYYDRKSDDVTPRLEQTVNSGDYQIIKVQSVYDSGYLLAAEVYYTQAPE